MPSDQVGRTEVDRIQFLRFDTLCNKLVFPIDSDEYSTAARLQLFVTRSGNVVFPIVFNDFSITV